MVKYLMFVSVAGLIIQVGLTARSATADFVTEMEAAWKERVNRLRTAQFDIQEQVVYEKGRWTEPVSTGRVSEQPPHDVSFFRSAKLMLDREMIRYESDGFIWDSRVGTLVPRRNVATFDGTTRVNYYPLNADGNSDAHIENATVSHYGNNVDILPIMLTFRALTAGMCPIVSLSGAVSVSDTVDVDGAPCAIVDVATSLPEVKATLYVDPKAGFVVKRFVSGFRSPTSDFVINSRADIQYELDEATQLWIPKSWNVAWRPGNQGESYRAELTQFVINPEIDQSQFGIPVFAPGTLVYDLRGESSGIPKAWIVKADGTSRTIPPSDYYTLSRDQLLSTEPGAGASRTGRGLLIFVNGLVVLGILVWIMWRRIGPAR